MQSFTRTLTMGLTAVLLAAGSSVAVGACGPDTTISPTADFAFTFKVCDTSLVGAVTARATGWVAIGFSRDQYMPDTDVFMAGVLPNGIAYGKDAFAYFRSPPVIDASQDFSLLSASEKSGITSYSFSRQLSTGDAMDFDLTDGAYYILSAFNSTSDDLTTRHSYADASDLTYIFSPIPEVPTMLMLLAGGALLAVRLRRSESASR